VKDVTLLIAHPDDEALFCWPVLDRVKRIVCASNDAFNPDRAWCKERGLCLKEVGLLLDCEIVQLPHHSEFYRMPTRDGQLKGLAEQLAWHLAPTDILFSHNAWGEYGNIDHILMHHVARTWTARTQCTLLTSDIAQEINWLPITPWNQHGSTRSSHTLDRPLFDRIKAIYDARGCWTWSWEPQEACKVYSL
jgi:LmbE family N-acetylglucosaminyl deacetylase